MYDYMIKNMILINIIFRDTVIILTIKHSPVYRHKIINNQYPTDDTTMVKLHGIYSVRTAVKQPVASQEAPEAVIHFSDNHWTVITTSKTHVLKKV